MALRVRLAFRSRTPISIKIAVALFLAFQVTVAEAIAPTVQKAQALLSQPVALGVIAAWIAVALWVVVASLRLSRWPLPVLATVILGLAISSLPFVSWGFHPTTLINLASEIAAWLLLAALVLPHWRRLNWRPLGHLEPFPDVADEFS